MSDSLMAMKYNRVAPSQCVFNGTMGSPSAP